MDNKLAVKTNKVSNGKPQRVADVKQLQELGFEWLSEKTDMYRRFAIAYEHYRRMSEEAYWNERYLCARFEDVEIEKWDGDVPPNYVLSALRQAIERKCFKRFVIYAKGNDPMLMGLVADGWKWERPFVIVSWGDDIDPEWLEKNTV